MSLADSKLDALLQDVPLPDGLLVRLMAVPLAGDENLDELVRDVAVPSGLLERLRAIALAGDDGLDDDALDEALRAVPVPDDLLTSCRRHPHRYLAGAPSTLGRGGKQAMDRVLRISRLATAAALILAVTLSLTCAMLLSLRLNNWEQMAQKQVPPPSPTLFPPPPENHLETSWSMLAEDRDTWREPAGGGGSQPGSGKPAGTGKREIELAEIESSGTLVMRDQLASTTMPRRADPLSLPVGLFPTSHNSWDEQPELSWRPADLLPHGLDWPLVPPANRHFLVQTGFHPFVSPAAHPRLQTCPVPLAIEPTSYELARRYLERNEWPPADRVRTEEFLAAVDYNFPKPQNQSLGLIVAGGPSPIGGEGYCLLQVGVQARQTDQARHAPLHLVLLVDTSTSMCWGSRMEIVRRALGDLPGMVGGEDRLSLVAFNQAAHVLVENLPQGALAQFAAAADSLSAEGATNIVAGLREAYGVARSTLGPGPGTRARVAVRVVLLTDGLLDLEPAALQKIGQQVAQAAEQKIPLDVIDLGQQKEADPQVASLAEEGRGTVHRAISAEQVRWALREIVTGRSQVVARGARLQVTFNPKSVLEYRLVGHESGDWASLLPGPLEADFHEGQSATALFEVRLAPNGPQDLAAVDLTWYASDGAKTQAGKTAQTARTMVERKHFAASLTTSAPSLQEAAVVAYATEVLRHSPFIFHPYAKLNTKGALMRAVELSGQIDGRVRQLPSFEEFVAFIQKEVKARPAKRPVKE